MQCPHCDENNPPKARYCMGCGSWLGHGARLEELRRVTVLFADIAGSTAMIQGSNPEAARARLEPTVALLRAAIRESGGTIARVAGDGIKAIFGAPVPSEQHALQACFAALRIQQTAAQVSMPVRVGINTGTVLLCSVATDLHIEYAAEGEATHLAAKAQQAAAPGTTAITGEVAALVQGFVETRRREALDVPGMHRRVELHVLVGRTGAGSRFEVALRRGLTPLVGRENEIAMLQSIARGVSEGERFACVAVLGEAGIGKSRLLWEFGQWLAGCGWRNALSTGTRGSVSIAFHPLVTLLRTLWGVTDDDDPQAVRRRLDAATTPEHRSALLKLLDLDPEDPGFMDAAPERRRQLTYAAIEHCLLAAAVAAPLALMIDDLDDTDAETRAILEKLARRAPAGRLLVVLEGRTESHLQHWRELHFLRLGPLSLDHAATLFRHLTGANEAIASRERRTLERTAGNPYFLEESVRLLADSGEVTVPGTVADILESRIASLPLVERRVLQLAAVLGRDVPSLLLRAVLDEADQDVTASMAALVAADLMVAEPSNAHRYRFRHAVVQETAYALLKPSERRRAHARLVGLLESPDGEGVPDRIDLLAYHCTRAQDWHRAISYLQGAAQRAADRAAPREVVRLLDEALQALEQVPPEGRGSDREVSIRLAMAFPLVQLGNLTRTAREVESLEVLEPRCENPALRGRLAAFVSGQRWLSGELVRASMMGERAIEIGTALEDQRILVPARQCLAGTRLEQGRYGEALELLAQNLSDCGETTSGAPFGMAGPPAAAARATRCWIHEHLGHFEDARREGQLALRIAIDQGSEFAVGSAVFALGSVALASGEAEQVIPTLEQAFERAVRGRLYLWVPVLGSMLATALCEAGDRKRATTVTDQAVPVVDDVVRMSPFISLMLVRAYWGMDRHETAVALIASTLERITVRGALAWEPEALLLQCELHLLDLGSDWARLRTACARALTLAQGLKRKSIAARCQLLLASIEDKVGEPELADAHRREAASTLQAIGATGLLRSAHFHPSRATASTATAGAAVRPHPP